MPSKATKINRDYTSHLPYSFRPSFLRQKNETPPPWRIHAVLIVVCAYMVLTDRVYLTVNTDGRGLLQILPLALVAIASIMALYDNTNALTILFTRKHFVLWYAPFCILYSTLPILGIAVNDYPARTILTIMTGVLAIACLAIGFMSYRWTEFLSRLGPRYLVGCICVQFAYAALQFALLQQSALNQLLGPLREWDVAVQGAYSADYILVSRSTGLYINANHLGFWGAMMFWSALVLLRGWSRVIAVSFSLATLVFSQSRGGMFALAAGMVVWLFYLLLARGQQAKAQRAVALLSSVVIVLGVLFMSAGGVTVQEQWIDFGRIERGWDSVFVGREIDPSFDARIRAWEYASDFYWKYPLGTFGEPRALFGHFIDSDLVRAMLQGGPALLISTLLPLAFAITRLMRRGSGLLLALYAATITMAAVSSHPLTYQASGLFWIASGYHLAATKQNPRTLRSHRNDGGLTVTIEKNEC